MFKFESKLVNTFKQHLISPRSPFDISSWAQEFYYLSGRVDLLALDYDSRLLTFEAKLTKWRYALGQAYRNGAFSDFSFVVLPEDIAHRAILSRSEFQKRHVGIVSVSISGIEILLQSKTRKRLQPWLSAKAIGFLDSESMNEPTAV